MTIYGTAYLCTAYVLKLLRKQPPGILTPVPSCLASFQIPLFFKFSSHDYYLLNNSMPIGIQARLRLVPLLSLLLLLLLSLLL